MAAPDWVSYVAAVTGVIGAITGFVGYRQSNELKSLELRIGLRKAEADLRNAVPELVTLLELTRRSRQRVAAATGMYKSGALEQWLKSWEEDAAAIENLRGQVPEKEVDYTHSDNQELESRVVAVHALTTQANQLREKHLKYLAADDKERDRLKANIDRQHPPAA